MKLFKRTVEQEEKVTLPRIQRADTATLLSWFDNTIMGLGSSFDRWRYHDGPIEEVEQHIEALDQMFTVLKSRKS